MENIWKKKNKKIIWKNKEKFMKSEKSENSGLTQKSL